MIKIGLVGKMRSGKDTFAEYVDAEYGMTRFAFGDPLKKQFHEDYPHIPKDPKPVRGYQLYGQLMRYVKGNDIWINKTFERINLIKEVAENYNITGSEVDFRPVITDIRQPNEVDRCKAEGFIIIRVNCPDEIRLERIKAAGDNVTMGDLQFETETILDTFEVDYEIDNSGTLEELYAQIDEIMQKHGVTKVKTKGGIR